MSSNGQSTQSAVERARDVAQQVAKRQQEIGKMSDAVVSATAGRLLQETIAERAKLADAHQRLLDAAQDVRRAIFPYPSWEVKTTLDDFLIYVTKPPNKFVITREQIEAEQHREIARELVNECEDRGPAKQEIAERDLRREDIERAKYEAALLRDAPPTDPTFTPDQRELRQLLAVKLRSLASDIESGEFDRKYPNPGQIRQRLDRMRNIAGAMA